MQITFLGTGTSYGIPVIGCTCDVCTSPDPRNKRNRTGVWIHGPGYSGIIDVSSEFRIAALNFGLTNLDFALLTHSHSDHISGMDDLRIFSQNTGNAVPLFGDQKTLDEIIIKYAYAFTAPKGYGGGVPQFNLTVVEKTFEFAGLSITPIPVFHGPETIFGYRLGNFAFLTDLTKIPESSLGFLQGLDVLALDCLRMEPHSTHLCFEESVRYAKLIGAKQTYFVHMAHSLDHAYCEALLPSDIRLAYDGLEVTIQA